MRDKILMCIPAIWANRSEFVEKLVNLTKNRFDVQGNYLLDRKSGFSFEFSVSPPAEGLETGFEMGAAADPFPDALLEKIRYHQSILSLYADKNGVSTARAMAEVAGVALDLGGLAVRVEGSKRASSPDRWHGALIEANSASTALRRLFVWDFVKEVTTYDTIGMPFLGYPDISIETGDLDVAKAIYDEFSTYLLLQSPTVRDGQSIGFEGTAGVWRMNKVEHIYHDDPHLDFSYGAWRLTRVDLIRQ